MSLRLPRKGGVAITPSQRPKSHLREEDILLTDYMGRVIQGTGKPSVEVRMHIAVYKGRRDVNAIIHTHSLYASALAASHQRLPVFLDEQAYFLHGDVLCADYAPSGSAELGRSAVEGLENRMAVLLANHGALSCGGTLEEAFRNALLLERTAHVYFLAKMIGGPVMLPRRDPSSLRSVD